MTIEVRKINIRIDAPELKKLARFSDGNTPKNKQMRRVFEVVELLLPEFTDCKTWDDVLETASRKIEDN